MCLYTNWNRKLWGIVCLSIRISCGQQWTHSLDHRHDWDTSAECFTFITWPTILPQSFVIVSIILLSALQLFNLIIYFPLWMRCKTYSQSCGKNKIFLKNLFEPSLEKKYGPSCIAAYLSHSSLFISDILIILSNLPWRNLKVYIFVFTMKERQWGTVSRDGSLSNSS